jgi:hypothetical protein
MKAISIMWSPGVHDLEAHIAVATLHEALTAIYGPARNRHLNLFTPEVRPFGNWAIPGLPLGTPYSSTRWYIEQTGGPQAGQVDGVRFLQTVLQEPWQKTDPHYDLAIIDRELMYLEVESQRGPLLGMAIPGSAVVISVALLREISDLRSRLLALRCLLLHFTGHMFGLPVPSQPLDLESSTINQGAPSEAEEDVKATSGGGTGHCSALCAMRYAPTVEILLAHAVEELQNRVLYCSRCRKELLGLLIGTYFGLS